MDVNDITFENCHKYAAAILLKDAKVAEALMNELEAQIIFANDDFKNYMDNVQELFKPTEITYVINNSEDS